MQGFGIKLMVMTEILALLASVAIAGSVGDATCACAHIQHSFNAAALTISNATISHPPIIHQGFNGSIRSSSLLTAPARFATTFTPIEPQIDPLDIVLICRMVAAQHPSQFTNVSARTLPPICGVSIAGTSARCDSLCLSLSLSTPLVRRANARACAKPPLRALLQTLQPTAPSRSATATLAPRAPEHLIWKTSLRPGLQLHLRLRLLPRAAAPLLPSCAPLQAPSAASCAISSRRFCLT